MRILGVRVDCLDMDGAVAAIGRLIEAGGPTRLVATVTMLPMLTILSDFVGLAGGHSD